MAEQAGVFFAAVANRGHARSDDLGRSWQWLAQPVPVPLVAQIRLPVCEPPPSRRCYRIRGREQVEESDDGGSTWRVGWQIPTGRRTFMEHYNGVPFWPMSIGYCGRRMDLGPYDLAMATRDGASTLVVALGNEGVLVRSADGRWERYPVVAGRPDPWITVGGSRDMQPVPTPYYATSLSDAVGGLKNELMLWLIAAALTLLGLLARNWRLAQSLGWLAAILVPAELLTVLSAGIVTSALASSGLWLAATCAVAVGLQLALLSVLWLQRRYVDWVDDSQAAWWGIATALAVFLVGPLPLWLWAYGVIPWYPVALPLSVALTLGVLRLGIERVNAATEQAVAMRSVR